jgi:hypothetical protein
MYDDYLKAKVGQTDVKTIFLQAPEMAPARCLHDYMQTGGFYDRVNDMQSISIITGFVEVL